MSIFGIVIGVLFISLVVLFLIYGRMLVATWRDERRRIFEERNRKLFEDSDFLKD